MFVSSLTHPSLSGSGERRDFEEGVASQYTMLIKAIIVIDFILFQEGESELEVGLSKQLFGFLRDLM